MTTSLYFAEHRTDQTAWYSANPRLWSWFAHYAINCAR